MDDISTYISVDGYILERRENETYRIAFWEVARRRMSKVQQSRFQNYDFIEIDKYKGHETDLFPCTSGTLFELVENEVQFFYKDPDTKVMKVVNKRTRSQLSRTAESKNVIPVVFRGNKKKYLYLEYDETEVSRQLGEDRWFLDFEEVNEELMLATERCNNTVYKQLGADLLVFSERDLQSLRRFHAFRGEYNAKSKRVCQAIYKRSRERNMLRYRATRTFRRPQVGESLLKTLHERSINEYALNFSPFLYMLLNIREFPLLMECFGEEDDVYDEVELQDDLSDEITVDGISRIFIRMLQDEDELGTILEIMVRLTAFDLRAERGTSEDADDNEEDELSEEDHAVESRDSTDSHPVLQVAGKVRRTYS